MKHYDVIILGLGAMGSAAAYELALRGFSVLGLEQFEFAHALGSSHGQTRIIRRAYFEHPDYVPMVDRAFASWSCIQEELRQTLLVPCPCLNIGLSHGELVQGVKRSAAEHQLDVEYLAAAELRNRFPQFHFSDAYEAVLERDAGFLYVEGCVSAMIDLAEKEGATLIPQCPVMEWSSDGSTVRVKTEREVFEASRLVITAGPWAGKMLRSLNLPLEVRRKPLFWMMAEDSLHFESPDFPIFISETPEGSYYGLPGIDDKGFKVGRHDLGEVVKDPSQVDRQLRSEDEREIRAYLQKHIPLGNGKLTEHKVCLYTMTPDAHFIIDQHPELSNVFIAAGFSGHGFKFAPVIGEMLSDLVMERKPALASELFQIARLIA